jgi:hypothetical protein
MTGKKEKEKRKEKENFWMKQLHRAKSILELVMGGNVAWYPLPESADWQELQYYEGNP